VLIILVFDQVTKYIINQKPPDNFPISIIPKVFYITRVTNTGIAFGMFQGRTNILIIISIIAIILIIVLKIKMNLRSILYNLALGLILGGALGNLIDRIFIGEVTDFLHLAYFAVFNLADSFIVIGFCIIILIIIRSFYKKRPSKD
jgi:signal peptidase II